MRTDVRGKPGVLAEANVVPLVDILLVLLVIFLIIPSDQKGLQGEIPRPAVKGQKEPEPEDFVVVEVRKDGSLRLNQEPVSWERLAVRLGEIYQDRPTRMAFIRGEAELNFAVVARALDILRGAGISVGLLTPRLEETR